MSALYNRTVRTALSHGWVLRNTRGLPTLYPPRYGKVLLVRGNVLCHVLPYLPRR